MRNGSQSREVDEATAIAIDYVSYSKMKKNRSTKNFVVECGKEKNDRISLFLFREKWKNKKMIQKSDTELARRVPEFATLYWERYVPATRSLEDYSSAICETSCRSFFDGATSPLAARDISDASPSGT